MAAPQIPKQEFIWMNGRLVKWDDAKIHVLSHVVHYGSSVFEGMRVYKTAKGPCAFRLQEHTERLFNSAKIYRMEISYSPEQINEAILNLVGANNLEECYVRPIIYRGYGKLGVDPAGVPVEIAIGVWPWGKYLGEEALEKGVAVGVSSWNRFAPNTLPSLAKSGANYMNSQLIKMEARRHGYVEGIALDTFGFVSEGSGENVFIVRDGVLITPPLSSAVLPGITRRSILRLAQDLKIRTREEHILREALYIAQEVFFAGTAAEITPISSVDGISIGAGRRGPLTTKIQKAFFDIINGEVDDRHGWLTPVPVYSGVPV